MTSIPIYQVDAFSSKVFRGNPAAVCPLETWLPDQVMQDIAAEVNLSETAFFVPDGDNFHLRWFTPVSEVDLCGHATLATAHVVFHYLAYKQDTVTFNTRSGPLTVRQNQEDTSEYFMSLPAPPHSTVECDSELYKLTLSAVGVPVVSVHRASDDVIAILACPTSVVSLAPNMQKIADLPGIRGLIVTAAVNEAASDSSAPATLLRDIQSKWDETPNIVSRTFFPSLGIDEDPVCGSAHAALTPLWAEWLGVGQGDEEEGPDGEIMEFEGELIALQASKRGGILKCVAKGGRVTIRGNAVTFMEGKIKV